MEFEKCTIICLVFADPVTYVGSDHAFYMDISS